MQDKYDYINPSHYQKGGKEVIEMMEDIWGPEKLIAHCEMCAFKYRMRVGEKPNQPVERDLEKARWYENKAQELRDKGHPQNKNLFIKPGEGLQSEVKDSKLSEMVFPVGRIRNHLKEVINDPPNYLCGYYTEGAKTTYSVLMGKLMVCTGYAAGTPDWENKREAMDISVEDWNDVIKLLKQNKDE